MCVVQHFAQMTVQTKKKRIDVFFFFSNQNTYGLNFFRTQLFLI